jgi:hypothetical protein
VNHLFAEVEIGFEEIDDGLWNVYFGPAWLGRVTFATQRPMRRGKSESCGS